MKVFGVVGLGLIGGSMALGLKAANTKLSVIAYDTDDQALAAGLALDVIDEQAASISDLSARADLICVCTPVMQMKRVMAELSNFEGTVTDVCSVKGPVVDAAKELWGGLPANWVPGHPIAGSEKHSVRGARPDLFQNHKTILTPNAATLPDALNQVTKLWQTLGAEVVSMTIDHHDDVLAQTSHLPHLLAYTLVDVLAGFGDEREVFEYAAGGFRDFSRIAASDPVMWHDIFMTNQAALLKRLKTMVAALEDTANLIENNDSDALMLRLKRAKAARDYFTGLQPDEP